MTVAASDHSISLHGVNPSAAIDAIRNRAARWRAGDRSPDGRKIGLVIEGGAMRGVLSGGGSVAMAHLGFEDLFDEVYATSAGAMNAAYFLSGQGEYGMSIYLQDLVSRRFINPLRLWRMLDIDYVFDHVVSIARKLHVDRVLASRSHLFVAVSDMSRGEPWLIDTRTCKTPLLTVLKASTAVPILYNRTVEVEGRPCRDGALLNPFPIAEALASGCTDLLVLLTRPASFRGQAPTRRGQWLFNRCCVRGDEKLCGVYRRHFVEEAKARDLATGRLPTPPGVNVATICPDVDETIDRATRDPLTLHAAALRYGQHVLRIFGGDQGAWVLHGLPT